MRILVIDNDASSRQTIEYHLQSLGHEGVFLAGIEEGWGFLEDDPSIDLVIGDWPLPGEDGLAFCRRIRETKRPRYLPILFLATPTESTDAEVALDAGADAFLAKPFSLPELQASLRVLERIVSLEERVAVQARDLEDCYVQLEELTQIDELTQILNRQAVIERLEREVSRASRYRSTLSVVLVNLDRFRSINDTHGHPIGDSVLRKAAEILKQSIRNSDCVGRYEGEEFLILLPGISGEDAIHTAERLRRDIESAQFSLGPQTALQLTISAGLAEYQPQTDTPNSLLTRADRALYTAKEGGRNRVCMVSGGGLSAVFGEMQ